MKKATSVLLAFSLALNFLIGGFLMYQYLGLPQAKASNIIADPGTYGPPAMEIIDDNTTIITSGVTLQNTLVTGDLILSEEIGQGTVTLDRVEVQGDLIIRGGSYKLLLVDCTAGRILVQQHDGALTIVARGRTGIGLTLLEGQAQLQEDGLDPGAPGFKDVRIKTEKRVLLLGDFDAVDIEAKADVKVTRGHIQAVSIAVPGAVLDLAQEAGVETLTANAKFQLTGAGSVHALDLNCPGLFPLQGQLGDVTCRSDGIFLELHAGSIARLLIPPLETAVSVALADGASVEYAEINARAGFTGLGQIDKAVINHDGVTMDRRPADIVIKEGLTVTIAGEEYTREPDPVPLPQVGLNSLTNISLLPGEAGSKTLRPEPDDAKLTAWSGNTGVATVSLSGNQLTVTAKKPGKAVITVEARKEGYATRTRTFTVTVHALSEVKTFQVENPPGGEPGYKLVIVGLFDPNPSQYIVKIGDIELKYLPNLKVFRGSVPENLAKKSNVKVSKK